jgi:prepilin-type N-terminal cleavage/methylation domain-containing protein
MRSALATATKPAVRRGVTIVEVLVALVIVTIGLLGVSGSSVVAMRAVARVRHERAATNRALSRLALLYAGGCGRAASGELEPQPDGLGERWIVEHARPEVALLTSRVEWRDHGRPRALVLRSALLC